MKKIVVTGASGYVGGRLLDRLRRSGAWEVVAVSRTRDAARAFVSVDIADGNALSRAAEGAAAVINLVGLGEAEAAASPASARGVTAGTAAAWASAAARAGVPRFVQLSTAKVYGRSEGVVDERHPCAASSAYATAHLEAEGRVMDAHAGAVVMRLSNGFGAPAGSCAQAWRLIVNDFCLQASRERAIAIASSGGGWRNFVPLSDVTSALEAGATSVPAGIYNLGAPASMTLRDAADRVATTCERLLGYRPSVRTGPADSQNPAPLDFRIDRLAAAGFLPGTTFEEEAAATLLAASAVAGSALRTP